MRSELETVNEEQEDGYMAVPPIMQKAGLKIGLLKPEDIAQLTGLEMVEGMGTGILPMPPMAGVLPIVPHKWSEGEAEFRALPETRFSNPMGSAHGGWAMTMLDTAMAIACHSTLRRGEAYTSMDTAVRFVRPIVEKRGELRIFGRVISRGRTVAVCDGRIEDADGKVYATGSSSCMIMKMGRPPRDTSDTDSYA